MKTALTRRIATGFGALALLAGCDADDALQPILPEIVGDAIAFGIWAPAQGDTCTPAVHDQYYAVGPDGLRYPTWHPPVDPSTGCTLVTSTVATRPGRICSPRWDRSPSATRTSTS